MPQSQICLVVLYFALFLFFPKTVIIGGHSRTAITTTLLSLIFWLKCYFQ